RALVALLRLQRVDIGEARQTRDLLVEARVVFHGARTEREQAEVDGIILPREPRVVADGFGFGEARESDGTRAFEVGQATSPSPPCGRGVGGRGSLNRALSLRRVA